MNIPTLLLIGIEDDIKEMLSDIFSEVRIEQAPLNAEKLFEFTPDLPPCLVLSCAPKEQDPLKAQELGELLRSKFKEVPIYLYFKNKVGFQKNLVSSAGFSELFLLPADHFHMRSCLSEIITAASMGEIRFYKPVKLKDIQPNDVLEFDTNLYLPMNRKYIRISKAGDSLDEQMIQKIRNHQHHSIYVSLEQLNKFYQYSAQRLKQIQNSGLTDTEKQDQMKHAIRDLFIDLFDDQISSFESGQSLLKNCTEIVKNYILSNPNTEWYSKIERILGQVGDEYSHAGNVSTLAALFSIGLNIGNPEEVAIAGLLHDIGVSELPYKIQNTHPDLLNADEWVEYKKHPEITVNLIKSRKINVPESVTKMILQHHELYNGGGYPKGLFGDRILKEAQILAIADRFDELTSIQADGKVPLKPVQALNRLLEEQMQNPSKIKYDPELLKKILDLFPKNPLIDQIST